jgi:microcystin-dependent protein
VSGTQFISEIRLFPFGVVPNGWVVCAGQTMSIMQNQPLFALIGTAYGGDGIRTFNLPNLGGKAIIGTGTGTGTGSGGNYVVGQSGGEATHTLRVSEMASHGHSLMAKAATADETAVGTKPGPTVVLAQGVAANSQRSSVSLYGAPGTASTMAANTVGQNAGGVAHENRQPYLVLNYCIALTGIFPSRN